MRARAIAENTLIEQAGAEPLDVDEIVDRAVQEARPDRTIGPDGGPSPTVGRLAF